LRRATDRNRSAEKGLKDLSGSVSGAATGSPYEGKSNAEIVQDDLAIWVETRLGLKDVHRKPGRASPRSLKDAANILSIESGQPEQICEQALRNFLLAFSLSEKLRGYAGAALRNADDDCRFRKLHSPGVTVATESEHDCG
jgi:hypothetical protein